ncbi:putative metal-dependent hydrolase YabD [Planctomycetales bacterium]|nr:putative metal-dependent hydrolase YabD [Planctomycetales bacterium]
MIQPIPIFDTHAHLDLEQFDSDRDAVIRRLESGTFPGGLSPEALEEQPIEIAGIIIPGIDAASCRHVVKLAEKSDRFHAAVAIHPNHAADVSAEDWQTVSDFAHRNDVTAIGETGLDRYWDNVPIEVQIEMFRWHIDLSQETDKPVLIHCRDAWDDLLPILREVKKLNGVIHAFSGEPEQALECVELGLSISFAGSVTYRNAKFSPLWEATKVVSADRLLIETDSPFMTPHPYRGKLQRNEPTMAAMVALRLAELRGQSVREIAEITTQNAKRIFRNADHS